MTTFALPRSFIPRLSKDESCIPEETKEIPEATSEIPEETNESCIPEGTNEIPEATSEIPEETNEIPKDTKKSSDPIQETPEFNESAHEETTKHTETLDEREFSETRTDEINDDVPKIPETITENNKTTQPIEDTVVHSDTSLDIEIDIDVNDTIGTVKERDSCAKDSTASASVLEVEFTNPEFKSFADKHTIKELRDLCKSRGLQVQGKKLDLAERYWTNDSNEDDVIICSS
jgi:predicted nuclease of restriction endonuclease-like RecB superfamily